MFQHLKILNFCGKNSKFRMTNICQIALFENIIRVWLTACFYRCKAHSLFGWHFQHWNLIVNDTQSHDLTIMKQITGIVFTKEKIVLYKVS